MSTFVPPLSTHTTVGLPPSIKTASSRVVITFRATRISGGGDDPNVHSPPLPQLWTNLPTATSAEPDWRAIPFVPLESAEATSSTPPPSAWPVLSVSNADEAISELPPPPATSLATVETTADASLAGREYGYTYRVQHPDGGIEWLGSDGSNGSFKFELEDAWGAGSGGGDSGGPAEAGRWAVQSDQVAGASHANGNGETNESKVIKQWAGGEGEVPDVRIEEQWGGIGISWDSDVPTAHLLSSTPTSAPLSTIVLHPVVTPPPIHHVGLPPTPLLLTAETNSFFLATGSAITVRHAVSGSSPSATLRSGRPSTLPAESGLEVLPSTGETTALLATKSNTVFLYSAQVGASASVGIELPKTEGQVAVYSAASKSIVAIEQGKTGVVLKGLAEPLSTLKVIELHRVAGSDILVGSIDASTQAHVKMAPLVESNGHTDQAPAAANGHDEDATPAAPTRAESASSDEGDAESEADEVDPAATDPVQDPSPSSVVAVVLRFFANVWQALLAFCGVQSAHDKARSASDAEPEVDVNGEAAPNEQTPLLSHSLSAHSHLSTTTTLAPSSPAVAKQLLAKVQDDAVIPTLYAPETLVDAGLVISSSADTVEVKVRRAGQTEWREVEITEETKLGGEGWVTAQLEVQEGSEEGKGEWEVWVEEKKGKKGEEVAK